MSLAEGKEITECTILFIRALRENAMGSILLVRREDFIDFLFQQTSILFFVFLLEIFYFLLFVYIWRGEFDNARVVVSVVFCTIHEGGHDRNVGVGGRRSS